MGSDQEQRMAQYLLGQLSEEEQAELDRRYLADNALFEELLAIEDDLRDAYARGELSGPDREAFERRLLVLPRQKEKQEFARLLLRGLPEVDTSARTLHQPAAKRRSLLRVLRASPRTILAPALSAALLIVIVGGWWLARRLQLLRTPRQAISQGSPGVVPPTAGRLPGQGPEAQAPNRPPGQLREEKTFAFVLTPGLLRGGGESKPLVIPPEADRVRLEARFEGQYPRYQAVIETVEGRQVASEGNLQAETFPGGLRIFLEISSSLLVPGDYILIVRGVPATGRIETVAEYTFRIGKR